jgi:HPt (histidine-containing phosphotransfer) domain-containing protein
MVDNIDPDKLKKGEIFDFDLAANTYYFPVDELIQDGFKDFITTKILGEFIKIRKSFVQKNYSEVRSLSHKLKSVFSMLGAINLYKCFEQMQKSIDNNTMDNIDDIYISLLKDMKIFFNEIVIFCRDVAEHPVSESLIRQFEEVSKECDLNESNKIKSQINSNDSTKNVDNIEGRNLEVDPVVGNPCCSQACIII